MPNKPRPAPGSLDVLVATPSLYQMVAHTRVGIDEPLLRSSCVRSLLIFCVGVVVVMNPAVDGLHHLAW